MGIYGDLLTIYLKPYSIYLRGTITQTSYLSQGPSFVLPPGCACGGGLTWPPPGLWCARQGFFWMATECIWDKPTTYPHQGGKSVYFFVVWSFLLFGLFGCYSFCCLGGSFFFAVWAGAQAPPKQQKKKTRPRPNSKTKKKTPLPSVFFFCCLSGWSCLFFWLFGRGGVFFFWLFGQGRVLFLLFGRGRVLFLLFGPGTCVFFFFAVWAGDGSSLTYPSAWLVFKRPNNKETEQRKKKKKKKKKKKNTGSTPRLECGKVSSESFQDSRHPETPPKSKTLLRPEGFNSVAKAR